MKLKWKSSALIINKEIIAPTFSPKLKPHLNIVTLNPQTMQLEWSNQNILGY